MVNRDELIEYLNDIFGEELLLKAKHKDEMANGVQFIGKKTVSKIAFGVSLNENFLIKAVKWGAEMCVFHHGFDVRTYKSIYSKASQKRLRLIFKNDLTIVAYHYALDAHPDVGNNVVILNELGAAIDETFYDEWGYIGILPEPQSLKMLEEKCEKLFNHKVFSVHAGKKKISKIGVCSGGAKPYDENISEMVEEGVELFISGETSESSPSKMLENEISYFACGHYATEVFGVKELASDLESEYGDKLIVKFIDIKSPI